MRLWRRKKLGQLNKEELKEQVLELAEYLSAITNNADAELVREAVRRLG